MTSLKITEQKCWEIYWDIEVFKNLKFKRCNIYKYKLRYLCINLNEEKARLIIYNITKFL